MVLDEVSGFGSRIRGAWGCNYAGSLPYFAANYQEVESCWRELTLFDILEYAGYSYMGRKS